MADKSLKFDIIADPDKAIDALKEVAKATEKIEGETVTFTADADVDQALASIKALRDHLESISKVRPDLDVSGAVAGLDRLEAKAREAGKNIRGATDDLGKGAIQSVGPLRDVSAAFGNVGVGALDAAEGVLGFGESLATVNPKFEKFFAIASRSAFIGGALAAGVTIASKALADFTGASSAVADALKTLAFADKAAESMTALAKALGSSAIQNGLRVIGSGGKDIEGFNDVLKESPAAALQLITVLAQTGENVDQLRQQYEDYATSVALSAQESQRFAEDVEVRNRALELGLDITGKSTLQIEKETAALERGNAARLQNRENMLAAAEAQDEAARSAGDAADENERLTAALEEQNSLLASMVGGILEVTEARAAADEEAQRFVDLQKEGKSSTDDLVVAAQHLAEAHAKHEEAQAAANGQTYTATQRQASLVESLKATAAQAKGPTKDAILAVVEQLEAVPPEVPTTMTVNNAEALRRLNEQIRLMQIIRDTSASTVAALRAVPGGAAGAILGQAPITQNITVNAGFGTDAFAVRQAVLASAKQAARLTQNAVRFTR